MPYGKKYTGRRRTFKRTRRAPRTTARKAAAAYTMARRLKSVVHPEFKWYDAVLAPTTIPNSTTGPAILQLSAIPQGDSVNEREGNRAFIKSFMWRAEITGPESCRIRLMLLRDLRRSYNTVAGTMPNINPGDILQSLTYPMVSPYQMNQSGRFKILFDRTYNYDHDEYPRKTIKYFTKMNHQMRWATNTMSEPNVGALYLLMVTDASNVPSIAAYSRIRWIDG